MRFVLIPDKFKGSLSAAGVISALTAGIKQVYPEAEIASVIASDGGDGFLQAIADAIPVDKVECTAVDPLMRSIPSQYLLDKGGETAYIELAACSGLVLLDPSVRNPLKTTTLGTGMQIRDALKKGAKKIYIGLGGSATNDGGIGIAHALGYRFTDASGEVLDPVGGNLSRIDRIETREVIPEIKDANLVAVNDVLNPLLGSRGAARVYAAQKGAGGQQIRSLEEGLQKLDSRVRHTLGKTAADLPGAGAAGGAAYGLHVFLHAEFVKGIDFMLHLTNTEALFKDRVTDLLITGEGAIDEQTLQGKLIQGVVDLGKRYGVPVVAVCGKLELEENRAKNYGLEAILEIKDKHRSVSYSMENAAALIAHKISEYLKTRKDP